MLRSALSMAAVIALVAAASAPAAPPTETPVEYAEIGNSTIAYRDLNPGSAGTPLILIAGYGLTMTEWDPAFVEELAADRRVVTIDNRGIGNSTGPVKRLTVRKMAKDAIRLARDLGFRRADVAGLSMGGYIAERVAIAAPGLVDRLILMSADPGSRHAIKPSRAVQRKLTKFASPQSLLPILFPESQQAAGQAWLKSIATQPNLTMADFSTPDATMKQQTLATGPRWYCKTCGNYRALPKIKAKTLVAHGTEDVVVPPGNARILAKRIKRSTTWRVPDAGHVFVFQSPSSKARRLGAWLDRGRATG